MTDFFSINKFNLINFKKLQNVLNDQVFQEAIAKSNYGRRPVTFKLCEL